jgi:non-ribosomal peptide synthetase component F
MRTPVWLRDAMCQHPSDAVALDGFGELIEYGQIPARATALAARLHDLLGPSGPVIVAAERGDPDTVVLLLALWANERVPLLVPRDTTAERMADIRRQLRAAALIRGGELVATYAEASDEALQDCPDPAYVVMTSGSTGVPKLVLCRWQGLEVVTRQLVQRYRIDGSSRVLQFAAPSYDAYLAEIVPALFAGATIVCLDDGSWTTPRRLAEAMTGRRITHATFPPSYLKRLLPHPTVRLKVLVSAGEALDPSVASLARRHTEVLVNAYGPCEATICATTYDVRGDESEVPLGRALSGVDVDVDAGTIRITGPTVAWGYLGDYQSAPGFLRLADGRAAFLTGDLAAPDDPLRYRGRNDRQRKLDGHRVDLAGVEQVLRGLAAVDDCAALEVQGELAAAVATSELLEEVMKAAAKVLPVAERPRHWRAVPVLPYLDSDKLDTRSVMALFDDVASIDSVKRGTDTELAIIWSARLPLPDGLDTDFFCAGGSSLGAMALLDDVYAATGIELDLADFLAAPTLRTLVALTSQAP